MQGRRRHFGEVVIIGALIMATAAAAGFRPVAREPAGMNQTEAQLITSRLDAMDRSITWLWAFVAGSGAAGAGAGAYFGARKNVASHRPPASRSHDQ